MRTPIELQITLIGNQIQIHFTPILYISLYSVVHSLARWIVIKIEEKFPPNSSRSRSEQKNRSEVEKINVFFNRPKAVQLSFDSSSYRVLLASRLTPRPPGMDDPDDDEDVERFDVISFIFS